MAFIRGFAHIDINEDTLIEALQLWADKHTMSTPRVQVVGVKPTIGGARVAVREWNELSQTKKTEEGPMPKTSKKKAPR